MGRTNKYCPFQTTKTLNQHTLERKYNYFSIISEGKPNVLLKYTYYKYDIRTIKIIDLSTQLQCTERPYAQIQKNINKEKKGLPKQLAV